VQRLTVSEGEKLWSLAVLLLLLLLLLLEKFWLPLLLRLRLSGVEDAVEELTGGARTDVVVVVVAVDTDVDEWAVVNNALVGVSCWEAAAEGAGGVKNDAEEGA
jgi:hypothetical protein